LAEESLLAVLFKKCSVKSLHLLVRSTRFVFSGHILSKKEKTMDALKRIIEWSNEQKLRSVTTLLVILLTIVFVSVVGIAGVILLLITIPVSIGIFLLTTAIIFSSSAEKRVRRFLNEMIRELRDKK
jgi:diacylglycerol kinase